MMKNIFGFFFVFTNILIMEANDNDNNFIKNDKIDSVVFSYYPFEYEDISPCFLKLYKDTLFIFTASYYNDTLNCDNINITRNYAQRITNQDTVNIIKNFVQLFIIDKTESIIIKDHNQKWEMDYTIVLIEEYKNGEILYYRKIIMYPEREYNPNFLQLCDLFHDIAKENTEKH